MVRSPDKQGTTEQNQRVVAVGGGVMRALSIVAISLSLGMAGCAQVSSYPVDLRYLGDPAYTGTGGERGLVTVAQVRDNRSTVHQTVVGKRLGPGGKEALFVVVGGDPATQVAKALQAYLGERGFAVRREQPTWDMQSGSIQDWWGDWVIGVTIEELSLNATSEYVKTTYECRLSMRVALGDVVAKTNRYSERLELKSSKTEVMFSADTADRMVSELLSEAVTQALVELEK
jgi:hypothetical protein